MILGGGYYSIADTVGTPGPFVHPSDAPLAYAAPAPASTATSTSGPAAASVPGISQARQDELFRGAAPRTAAEQAWVGATELQLRQLIQTLSQLQAIRQARTQRSEDSAFEARVTQLVNAERARYGLSALAYDSRLDTAAEGHNMQQATVRKMSHDGIGDADPGTRIRATGFRNAWGENVATGQLTPEQVVAEWMASPGHRRNILDPTYRLLGVSYLVGGDGRTYWAQEFGAA